jgi:hypothetical protein
MIAAREGWCGDAMAICMPGNIIVEDAAKPFDRRVQRENCNGRCSTTSAFLLMDLWWQAKRAANAV